MKLNSQRLLAHELYDKGAGKTEIAMETGLTEKQV